ncbi:MAG: hypothetical protein WBZ40_06655 [Acidimicrobiia bacterium]
MVVPDGSAPPSPGSGPTRRLGLAALVGLVGLVGGWILGSNTPAETAAGTTGTTLSESTIQSTVTTIAPASATSTPAVPTLVPPLRGQVDLFPNATALEGSVALATGGSGSLSGQNVWIVQSGGRLVQRADVPLQFGGAIDQMLLVGDYLIYAGGNGTFTLGSDLADPAEPVVGGPTFLIPGSGPSSAWVVGGYDPDWFAPFDGVTGLVGEQTQMNGLGFPLAGFDDGLLIAPNSPEINGRYVVWRPGGEPEPIDIELSPQAGLYTVSGQMAVSVSPGPLISVIDIDTNEIVAMMPFDSGEGLVSGVCLSPDLSYLAVVSSTGPVQVFRLATEELVGTMTTSATNWGVGWTGPSQLAFVAETSSGTRLHLFDPGTSFTVDVAQLAAPGEWRIATSGPVC